METRKIQSVGGGTYTVSIPKDWADAQGITTGDAVQLHEHIDGVLAVQAPESEQTAPSRISVTLGPQVTDAIERVLRAAYAAGSKTIILKNPESFTSEQRQVLSRVAQNLTGVSVVEDTPTEITVKTLLATDEVSVRQSVRQLRFVVLSMHRNATDALAESSAPDQFAQRDDQADRLEAMITRSFSRGVQRLEEVDALGVSRSELFELWMTTRELERVGDHANGIASAAQRVDDPDVVPELQSIAETTREIVSDAVAAIIDDAGVGQAEQALATRETVRAELDTVAGPDAVQNRIRRTAEHGGNIAEIALQQAIRNGELTAVSGGADQS